MRRLLPLLLLSLSLLACSKSGELATIEDAESYAKARGVVLSDKQENTDQRVAQRAFRYMASPEIHVSVLQFASSDAAATWKKLSDDLPMGREIRVSKGPVVFSVWGGADAERQKVVEALK